jgi:hypothetical protein
MPKLRYVLLVCWVLAPWATLAQVDGAAGDGDQEKNDLERVTTVGPVTATVRLSPAEIKIGDTLELALSVKAAEGVELLMPEFGESLDRYRILSYVPREKIADDGSLLSEQVYRLQASASGRLVIPPILIEFIDHRPGQKPSPDDYDAFELLTERLEFEARSVLPDAASADLHPHLGRLRLESEQTAPLWPWALGGVVLIAVAAPFVVRAINETRRRARRLSAYDLAERRLRKLLVGRDRLAGDKEAMDVFFVELSAIARRYLEDRFDLRAPELTTEEFLALTAQSPDLTAEHRGLLQTFLTRADMVKFARFEPSDSEVDGSIDAVRRFLDDTRADAPMLDEEVAHA